MNKRYIVTHTNLDLMRAIAVVTVLVDHTALNMQHPFVGRWNMGAFGVFGVYLFFVHTCLVLMWSLERRPHTLDFYVRRVFRIYPLAIVTVLILGLFRVPLYPLEHLNARVFLANLLLVQDLVGGFNMVGVLWSLPLEIQMYLFLPMLFLFARRERTFWPFLLLWGFTALLARATYGANMGNLFLSVMPHFLPGVVAYIAYKRFAPQLPAWVFPIALVLCSLFYMLQPSVQRGWLVCLFLGFTLPRFRDVKQPVVVLVSHTIAKYSYGVYLLHPFVLLVAFHYMRTYPLWVKLCVEVAGISVLAFLGYHLVENPLIRIGSRVANKLQVKYGTDYSADYGLDLA